MRSWIPLIAGCLVGLVIYLVTSSFWAALAVYWVVSYALILHDEHLAGLEADSEDLELEVATLIQQTERRGHGHAVTPENPPAPCRCIDCFGDQPEHDSHCTYMQETHS